MAAHLVQMRVLPQPHLLHAVRGEQPAGAAAAHRALQVAVIGGAGHCTSAHGRMRQEVVRQAIILTNLLLS